MATPAKNEKNYHFIKCGNCGHEYPAAITEDVIFGYCSDCSVTNLGGDYAVLSGATVYVGRGGYKKGSAKNLATKLRKKGKKARVMKTSKALFAR